MNYLSLCSGIEAATTAWHSMGWQPLAFSEIEPFPSAVLAHHWPHVPNLGDMTKWREWPEELLAQVDVLVGGTPCQAFSVAGLRNSLSDERGNLTLIYAHLLTHLDSLRAARGLPPVICLWENVPGVLSTKDNAFGCFLGALAGEESALEPPGTKWSNAGWVLGPQRAIAWRTLDAQYFGVAQRRRRVFLVASARNGFSPEAVLFEFQGVRRDSPPSRETRQVAPTIPARSLGGGGLGTDFDCDGGLVGSYWDGRQVSQTLDAVLAKGQTMPEKNRFPAVLVPEVYPTLDASFNRKWGSNQWVNNGFAILDQGVPDTAHTLRAEGFDASEDGTGRGTPLVPVTSPTAEVIGCLNSSGGHAVPGNTVQDAMAHQLIPVAIGFAQNTRDEVRLQNGDGSIPGALAAEPGMKQTTYVAFSCKDHGGDASEIAPTLRSMGHDGSHANGGGQVVVAIQDIRGLDKKQNGCGFNADGSAYTVDTQATQGVAFQTLTPSSDPLGSGNASTEETHTPEVLRTLRNEVGEEAFTVWGLGVLDSLQPQEVLQPFLHELGVRYAPLDRSWLVNCALPCEEARSEGALHTLWQTGSAGRASQGWQPSEQFTRELGAYLSLLSQPDAPTERFMRDLWETSEGFGVLREALSAIQKMGRPFSGENQSAPPAFAVRRLTVKECERLQGFPDGHTLIPWKKKPADQCPDGPRYKALGNSFAVPVVEWIGERINREMTNG